MRPSRVRKRWAEGRPALCTSVYLTDPSVCEMLSLLGYDGIWLDLEHHFTSLQNAAQMMRAARVGGTDIMARPAKGEFMRMARMLEAGAHGIMYPRCDDAAEAAEVVRWAKFAPMGERGFDGTNPDMPYFLDDPVEYISRANEETFIAIQVEAPAAVAQARAIAEVEGVDVVFFGPGDFSVLSGVLGKTDSKVLSNAMEQVARDALAAGKRFGSTCGTAEQARRLMDMGATLLAHYSDLYILQQGYLNFRKSVEPLGFAFEGAF